MTQPVLQTERLLLRELVPDDLEALHDVLGDPETMRFYPHPFSRDETAAWIERNRERYVEDGFGLWAVVFRESGDLVGDTGLTIQAVDGDHLVEVGWHINRRVQRRGIATEAGRASIDHAFRSLGLDRIISLIRPENEPSWRVAEKLGMSIWKETQHASLLHRVYCVSSDGWVGQPPTIRRPGAHVSAC